MPKSYIVFEGPRQSGKTHRLIGTILDRVARGWHCFVLTPYADQCKFIRERIKARTDLPLYRDTSREMEFRNRGRITFDCVENHGHTFHGQNIEQISLFMNDCEYKQRAFHEVMTTPHYRFKEIVMTRCTGPDAARPLEEMN